MSQKIRHLIKFLKFPTVVYTNHSATLTIVKSTLLMTLLIAKLNLKLVRAAEYLQCFLLNIYHKPGKLNVVLNALLWFDSHNQNNDLADDLNMLFVEIIPAYLTVVVEILNEFKDQIKQGYNDKG